MGNGAVGQSPVQQSGAKYKLSAIGHADELLGVRRGPRPAFLSEVEVTPGNAGTASGVELTSHSFRHFAASALISGGASVKQVQTFLGHTSAVITLRTCAHMWRGDKDRTRRPGTRPTLLCRP